MVNIIIAILALLGAIVVVAIVTLLVIYVLLSMKLSRNIQQTVEAMETALARTIQDKLNTESLLESRPGNVPPMRIRIQPTHLVPALQNQFEENSLAARIHDWLLEHSFDAQGDFYIEQMEGEYLRIYLSSDQRLVAATRFQPDCLEPYVEFCFDLGNGIRGGVSNPPGCPIALPEDAVGKYYQVQLSDNFELLSRMWLEAKELSDAHEVQLVAANAVSEFFEVAHAAEMDFRIASGGVSEAEIQGSFAAEGMVATTDDIAEIQKQWQEAIERHLLDYSKHGLKQFDLGREILIVHDGSVCNYLLERMRLKLQQMHHDDRLLCDQALIREMATELTGLLQQFSPREAMARFRPLLPVPLRYDLIDQLQHPIGADLYALPG